MEEKFYYVDPFDTEGLVPNMDERPKDDDEIIAECIDEMHIYNLDYEVIFTALAAMKDNNKLSVNEAFLIGFNEWVK